MFKGRQLLIATKHEKEKVIAPILAEALGVKCFVTPNFDTDALGTFTGEIERKDDPVTTARKKCLMAMEAANCDLAVASEGSFGPHPTLFFVPADDEFLFFMDKKNGLEIMVRELSTETNFNASEIYTEIELTAFAVKANFPSHGLILRKSKDDYEKTVKGITNEDQLNKTFHEFIAHCGTAYVETDMRAMYNPTRMKVIARATHKLAEKINTLCPVCKTPGFGITNAQKGLPCEACHLPTQSTLAHIYSCAKCTHTEAKRFPHGKQIENPMYCDNCNP